MAADPWVPSTFEILVIISVIIVLDFLIYAHKDALDVDEPVPGQMAEGALPVRKSRKHEQS